LEEKHDNLGVEKDAESHKENYVDEPCQQKVLFLVHILPYYITLRRCFLHLPR